MSKEAEFIGTLMPTHPQITPIIENLREKYNLPEISPDDDPIIQIYLGDEIISFSVFWQEIKDMVDESDLFINPESSIYKYYKRNKYNKNKPPKLTREELRLPKKFQKQMLDMYTIVQKLGDFYFNAIDKHHTTIADMIYTYVLTGESEEAPRDMFRKVQTVNFEGETLILAIATQVADPYEIMQQFHNLYEETFGTRKPEVTELTVSTAHYLRLQKMGHEWNYIVGEYIRLNKFEMPSDTQSPEYKEAYHQHEQRLRKRIERVRIILDELLKDVDK